MKKLLSILLVIVMLLSLAPVTLASEETGEPEELAEENEKAPAGDAEEPVIDEPAADGKGSYEFRVYNYEEPKAGFIKQFGINCRAQGEMAEYTQIYKVDIDWYQIDASGVTSEMTEDYYDDEHSYYCDLTVIVVARGASPELRKAQLDQYNGCEWRVLVNDVEWEKVRMYRPNLSNSNTLEFTVRSPVYITTNDIAVSGFVIPEEGQYAIDERFLTVEPGAKYTVTELYWYDRNGTALSDPLVFQAGMEYDPAIELTVNQGFSVDPSQLGEITVKTKSGETVETARVRCMEDNKRIMIYLEPMFTTKITLDRADFAVLETELTGGEPFPGAFGVPAVGSHITNPVYYWTDAPGNLATGIPEKGRYYWLNVYIEPDAGCTFGEAGTEIPVYADGEYVGDGVVENDVYGKAELLHLKLQRLGPAAVIRAAEIALTAPAAGEAIPVKPDGMPDTGSHFTIREQFWSTSMSTSGRLTSGTFTAGTTYYYYVELLPNDGCEFAGTPGRVTADELTVTANGEAAYSVAKSSDGKVTAYIPFRAEGTDYAGDIELTGLIPPVVGKEVSSHASAAESGYAVTDQGWADSFPFFFVTKTKDTAFRAGKAYYWVATVKLTGGRAFPEGYAGTVTVNGVELPHLSTADKVSALMSGETPQGGWDVNAGTDTMTIAYAYTTHSGVLPGDADGKGTVNRYDAALILRYLTGRVKPSDLDMAAADVDADGRITPNDAAVILSLP